MTFAQHPDRSEGATSPTEPGNPWSASLTGLPWLRGNLHCHTTQSDGRLSPQDTIDWFANAGYQLLALTDHNTVTDPSGLDARGMCLLTSSEVTAQGGELGGSYHLISLGLPTGAALPPVTAHVAESVARLREQGALVFIAHPHWSGLSVADLTAGTRAGAAGIEIYNGGTVLDSRKGEALTHWDEGLGRGERWWGIAVDDTHWHTIDRALGWVMVRAAEPSPRAVLDALAVGHFYASSGPEIQRVAFSREGDDVYLSVETSPCAAIYALSYGSRNQFEFDREAAARGEAGSTVTTASFKLRAGGPGGYVRIQCTDWQWRNAWSNPLYIPTS
ncbi:MAG TPA: CehA/McbA family metallohydrolase [Chloroflexota bacterium]|nr:CehA/McbA family metallohydrolase [Chloroflexota bacterium]